MSGSQLPSWDELAVSRPVLAATMRRYLQQVACSLRPGSVSGADLALRCFVTFLLEAAPDVMSVAGVSRRHIEDYKPWLAARPGRSSGRVTANTIAHRLGTLRMFFVRRNQTTDRTPATVPAPPPTHRHHRSIMIHLTKITHIMPS